MGTTTPNISIYVPAAGETNYDQAFLAGMLNVDAHNHTGGPDNGVVLGNASLATPYVTVDGTQITLGTPIVNPVWPSRCAFSAYLTADQVAATGDGTQFLIPFNAVLFNVGAGLNIATGVFTAPVAGRYLFTANIGLSGLLVGHTTGLGAFIATGIAYSFGTFNYGAMSTAAGELQTGHSIIINMAAGATISVQVNVNGGAKVVDVDQTSAANPITTFQGYLLG